jgi:hypothetical protein
LFSLRHSSSDPALLVLLDLAGVVVVPAAAADAAGTVADSQRRSDVDNFLDLAFGTADFLLGEVLAGSLLDIPLVFAEIASGYYLETMRNWDGSSIQGYMFGSRGHREVAGKLHSSALAAEKGLRVNGTLQIHVEEIGNKHSQK